MSTGSCATCHGLGWIEGEGAEDYCLCGAGKKLRKKHEDEQPISPAVLPIPRATFVFPTPRAEGFTRRTEPSVPDVAVFVCGGDRCPKGGVHVWDGPEIRTEHSSEGSCSKCGLGAIVHSMMNAP